MITIMICIVIGMVAGLVFFWEHLVKDFSVILLVGMCGMGGGILGACIATGIGDDIVTYEKQPIVSLRNQADTEGSFVLGCGSVGGVEYYVAWQVVSNDIECTEYRQLKVPVAGTRLIEYHDSSKQPHVLITTKGGIGRWGATPLRQTHKVYVPAGTVLRRFRVE